MWKYIGSVLSKIKSQVVIRNSKNCIHSVPCVCCEIPVGCCLLTLTGRHKHECDITIIYQKQIGMKLGIQNQMTLDHTLVWSVLFRFKDASNIPISELCILLLDWLKSSYFQHMQIVDLRSPQFDHSVSDSQRYHHQQVSKNLGAPMHGYSSVKKMYSSVLFLYTFRKSENT